MSSDLMEVVNFDAMIRDTRRGRASPYMVEFQVNPGIAPYLVSSLTAVVWVDHASRSSTIRAAVRKRQGIEADMVAAIADMGAKADWGNVHPLTSDGLAACVAHLRYYGLEAIEALVAPDTDLAGVTLPEGVPLSEAQWLPRNTVVVVPGDRSFVGSLGTIGQHKAVAVLHNPSRGVGVAWR
jgi:hypothetical protein